MVCGAGGCAGSDAGSSAAGIAGRLKTGVRMESGRDASVFAGVHLAGKQLAWYNDLNLCSFALGCVGKV